MAARSVLLGALALSAAACSSRCRREPPPPPAEPDEPKVEMLKRGEEPLRELIVGRWTGLRYRMDVTVETSLGLEGQTPVQTPASRAVLLVEVVRGGADPVIRERDGRSVRTVEEVVTVDSVTLEEERIPPATRADVLRTLARMRGNSTRQWVAEDGELVEVKVEKVGGERPPPEVARVLDEMWELQRRIPFRLPHGPVGRGARWRFSDPLRVRGMRAMQVSESEIVSLDDQKVRLRVRLRLQAPRQEVPHPVHPERTALLETLRGDGDGEIVVDRVSAVVLEGRLATSSTLRISAMGPTGERQTAHFIAASTLRATGRHLEADEAPRDGVPTEARDAGGDAP